MPTPAAAVNRPRRTTDCRLRFYGGRYGEEAGSTMTREHPLGRVPVSVDAAALPYLLAGFARVLDLGASGFYQPATGDLRRGWVDFHLTAAHTLRQQLFAAHAAGAAKTTVPVTVQEAEAGVKVLRGLTLRKNPEWHNATKATATAFQSAYSALLAGEGVHDLVPLAAPAGTTVTAVPVSVPDDDAWTLF